MLGSFIAGTVAARGVSCVAWATPTPAQSVIQVRIYVVPISVSGARLAMLHMCKHVAER